MCFIFIVKMSKLLKHKRVNIFLFYFVYLSYSYDFYYVFFSESSTFVRKTTMAFYIYNKRRHVI